MILCPYCGFTIDGPLHRDYCPSQQRDAREPVGSEHNPDPHAMSND